MRALTVERALAEAHKAGCVFRLAGAAVRVRGLDRVPPFVADFLRENRAAVFTTLGGSEHDRPCIELLGQLGVELVYSTDDDSAEAIIAEVLADAGDKPVAIDIETTPRPEYADPVPLKLTIRGRPMKVQPRRDDKAGLDPHRSEPRLVQLYGGGARVAVLDMRLGILGRARSRLGTATGRPQRGFRARLPRQAWNPPEGPVLDAGGGVAARCASPFAGGGVRRLSRRHGAEDAPNKRLGRADAEPRPARLCGR